MTEPIDTPFTGDEVTAYTAVPEVKPVPDAPYRGVEPFRFIDQQIFVARETETWNLLSSIMIYRGVLLYGGSGSGKSSMINAGLIPEALKENFLPNILRVQPRLGKEIKIERISIQDDGKPPYLSSSFTADDSQAGFECSIQDVHRTLKTAARTAPSESLIDYSKPVECPLLIFDQFEEFITLFEEAAHTGATNGNSVQKAQKAILDAVTDLIHDESLPIKILFVFREDYLGKLSILFENSPDLLDQYLRLLPPRVEKLQEIICAPFKNEALSAQFAKGQRKSKGEELKKLADRIAAELREHGGGSGVNLSELQIVCRKLWESNNPAALLKKENSIRTLIEGYWSDALEKFPGGLYKPAVALLGHMITSSGTRNIVSEDDLLTDEKKNFPDEALLRRALDALVQSKLVRREPRNKLYFYEIVSEYLVPWIQRLKAERLAELERVETRQNLEKAEAQNTILQRWRLGLAVVSILMLIALGGLGYFVKRARQARDAEANQKVKAEKLAADVTLERDKNKTIVQLLQNLTSISPDDRLSAIRDIEKLAGQQGGIPRELGLALLSMVVTDKDPTVVKEANALIPQVVKSNPDLRQVRANIQIESQDNQEQKGRADRIKVALTSKGIIVDAYAYGGSMPTTNELRYCGSEGGLSPEQLVQDIRSIDSGTWTISTIRGCENSAKELPRYYEVWFASDRRAVIAELRRIENEWKLAKRTGNAAVFRRVFADEFTNTDGSGHTYNKSQWIDVLRSSPDPEYTWTITNPKLVSFGGNTATLTFTNKTSTGTYQDTDTFIKRDGRWRVLASQSTLVSQ